MTLSELEELKARLEAATGPDDASEAFADLVELLLPIIGEARAIAILALWVAGGHESAAIALTEAVLPKDGLKIELSIEKGGPSVIGGPINWAHVGFFSGRRFSNIRAHHASSSAIALLLATINALIEREKNNE